MKDEEKIGYLKRMTRRVFGAIVGAAVLLGLPGAGHAKNIREYPEPWQTLDPGSPAKKTPRIEVLKLGQGAPIEAGDLVQLQVTNWLARKGHEQDYGQWWLWIGFRSSEETEFFSVAPDVAGGLLGIRQGTSLKILDPSSNVMDAGSAGKLRSHPFGNQDLYSWRKTVRESFALTVPGESGYSVLEIKRVCKGKAQFRTVHLFDDTPVRVSTGGISYVSKEPREDWIDEARIEAKCDDGKTATFLYGPVLSKNRKVGGLIMTGYFDRWYYDAWKKIPAGVQLK